MEIADNQVLDSAQRWVSEEIQQWSPAWRENLTRWLKPDLALIGDAVWGAQIRDLVKLPIPDPLAWANRRIELANGQWAIAGIRFRGRDVEKPFVDIFATSLPHTPAGVEALTEVLPHFKEFAPLCLRVNLPESTLFAAQLSQAEEFHGDAELDLLIVASPVDEMKTRPHALLFDATTLIPSSAQHAAKLTAEIYESLTTSRPQLCGGQRPPTHNRFKKQLNNAYFLRFASMAKPRESSQRSARMPMALRDFACKKLH